MKVKALENFCGNVSMCVGEVLDIPNDNIAKDLLRAGYIVEVSPAKAEAKQERKGKKNERDNG